MCYWPPMLIVIISYFIKIGYNLSILRSIFKALNNALLYILRVNKQTISFVNSKLLCAISLQSLQPLYSFSLGLAIIYQYFLQYLNPINNAFLQVNCVTKPNISFITSILLCAIGYLPSYSYSLKLAIIHQFYHQYLSPINYALIYVFYAT